VRQPLKLRRFKSAGWCWAVNLLFRARFCLALGLALTAAGAAFQKTQPSQAEPVAPSATPVKPTQESRSGYVGDDACLTCHQEKTEAFHTTAHFLTSRLPDKKSILGSFSPGENELKTSNPELTFRMEEKEQGKEKGKDLGLFQTAIEGTPPAAFSTTERIDFVVGSGNKGQTYLYWRGPLLFELPVSYWRDRGWVNSPGYTDGTANFSRPAVPRCLECHATYFDAIPPGINRYRKTGFTLGITCEKCHGPGQQHVQIHASKSAAHAGPDFQNPTQWPRERQIDLCAWCHAGRGENIRPAFSYVPPEPLAKYVDLPPPGPTAHFDVHGSQVELLEKSRCFQSPAMTCTTCHDVHTPQHDLAAFSQRCLTCHTPANCGLSPKLGSKIAQNCIDCHMPKQETDLIVFDRNGPRARPLIRNHWIKVYPETAAQP
jgi:Cytochrome c554 and c-prime